MNKRANRTLSCICNIIIDMLCWGNTYYLPLLVLSILYGSSENYNSERNYYIHLQMEELRPREINLFKVTQLINYRWYLNPGSLTSELMVWTTTLNYLLMNLKIGSNVSLKGKARVEHFILEIAWYNGKSIGFRVRQNRFKSLLCQHLCDLREVT